jgi:hypothetical protein
MMLMYFVRTNGSTLDRLRGFNAFVVVQLLLDQGALAEHKDCEGCKAKHGSLAVAELFMVCAIYDNQDNQGCTSLMVAIQCNGFFGLSFLAGS